MSLGGHFTDSHEFCVTTEHDVGSTPRHIGGYCDSSETTSLRHNAGFSGVVLGVQHLMLDTLFGQHSRELFALFHAGRSYQYGLALFMPGDNIGHDLSIFRVFIAINEVSLVFSDHRAVRRNRDDT